MIENEKAIIGCVLISKDILYKLQNMLKPEMFTDDFCRRCYTHMISCYDRNEPITIAEVMRESWWEGYDKEYCQKVIAESFKSVTHSEEAISHAKQIISEYKIKSVIDMYGKGSLKPKDIDDTIDTFLTTLEALKNGGSNPVRSFSEIAEELKDTYFNGEEEKTMKIGFPKIDECIDGLRGGDITVIGARPAVGKSAFVTQIITNIVEQGYKVGYYNLEMRESQVYERVLSRLSRTSLSRIKHGKYLMNDEKVRMEEANGRMKDYKNLYVISGAKKVSDIKAESRHMEYDLIVIDYLQLIRADRQFSNRASEVGDISKSLKALAMEMNIPIIALSQLNRVTNDIQEPSMNELRESGDIEQDASVICLMWNTDKSGQTKGFKIAKNRQGRLAKVTMEFKADMMQFEEMGYLETAQDRNTEVSQKIEKQKDNGFKNINFDTEYGENLPF